MDEHVRDDLYDSYCFFKRLDLEEGGMTVDDFGSYPEVDSPNDVYTACEPYKIRIGNPIARHLGNMYILFDVRWPNSHMLQVFWQLENGELNYKHVELFG